MSSQRWEVAVKRVRVASCWRPKERSRDISPSMLLAQRFIVLAKWQESRITRVWATRAWFEGHDRDIASNAAIVASRTEQREVTSSQC